MNIALLNIQITLQKNNVSVDDIGNHKSEWTDYYSCNATISGESGTEGFDAGNTVDHTDICFTVRFCNSTKIVSTKEYRVVFHDEIYDIISIDHMNYKKKSLKYKCRKVRP